MIERACLMGILIWFLVGTTACRSEPEGAVDPGPEESLSCALAPEEFEDRIGSIQQLLAKHCRERRALPDGYALQFDGGVEVREQVVALSKLEQECCPFLEWTIGEVTGESFQVEVTGPPEVQSLLQEVVGTEESGARDRDS